MCWFRPATRRLALQHDALHAARCERIFDNHASGDKTDRPGLGEALAYLHHGDALVVWMLKRLRLSMSHLIERIGELAARGVGFRSLSEQIDTTTSGEMGRFGKRIMKATVYSGPIMMDA